MGPRGWWWLGLWCAALSACESDAGGALATGLPPDDRVDRLMPDEAKQFCAAVVPFASMLVSTNEEELAFNCVLAGFGQASLAPAAERRTTCEAARDACMKAIARDANVRMPRLMCTPADLAGCRVTVGDYEMCMNAFYAARVAARQALVGVDCDNVADFVMRMPEVNQPQSALNAPECASVRQRCPNFLSLLL